MVKNCARNGFKYRFPGFTSRDSDSVLSLEWSQEILINKYPIYFRCKWTIGAYTLGNAALYRLEKTQEECLNTHQPICSRILLSAIEYLPFNKNPHSKWLVPICFCSIKVWEVAVIYRHNYTSTYKALGENQLVQSDD